MGHKRMSPLRAIRAHCLDCCGGSAQEVGKCMALRCPSSTRILFRDCSATTIVLEDPSHVRIASRLLGHRTSSTTEKYYNQARSVEACRTMQNFLLGLRRGPMFARQQPERDG